MQEKSDGKLGQDGASRETLVIPLIPRALCPTATPFRPCLVLWAWHSLAISVTCQLGIPTPEDGGLLGWNDCGLNLLLPMLRILTEPYKGRSCCSEQGRGFPQEFQCLSNAEWKQLQLNNLQKKNTTQQRICYRRQTFYEAGVAELQACTTSRKNSFICATVTVFKWVQMKKNS